MITEDYISLEVAKLLKEKGFAERVDACYAVFCENEKDIRVLHLDPRRNAQSLKDGCYPFVTQNIVLKWLRENYMIDIEVIVHYLSHLKPKDIRYYTGHIKKGNDSVIHIVYGKDTTEEVQEEIKEVQEEEIKYCLENLI